MLKSDFAILLTNTSNSYLMQWLEEDFVDYLKEWEDSVHSRQDVTDTEKTKMMLSWETIEGLQITGWWAMQQSSCTLAIIPFSFQ